MVFLNDYVFPTGMIRPSLGKRLKTTFLAVVSASAVTAMPAVAQSATASSPDKNETSAYSLLLERSSHLLRNYDTLLATVPIGSTWALHGMVYDTKDLINTTRIIGLGAKGALGKTRISASVNAPKEALGDALMSVALERAYDSTTVGVQATRAAGVADTTFVRVNARRGTWAASIFAGKNATFGTKGLPEELLLPLPITRLLGINTLASTELAENTIEKRVLGASVGYTGNRFVASVQYRHGTQDAGFLDDETFTAVETAFSYSGEKTTGRLETGLRTVAATRYANALFETRIVAELERKGARIETGVGAYMHGFGDNIDSCFKFRDALGAAVALRVRAGERWYGMRAHIDHEMMQHHRVLRIAGTLRSSENELLVGVRRDMNSYDREGAVFGGFIGYRGPVGKRLSLEGEVGYVADRQYGTIVLALRPK